VGGRKLKEGGAKGRAVGRGLVAKSSSTCAILVLEASGVPRDRNKEGTIERGWLADVDDRKEVGADECGWLADMEDDVTEFDPSILDTEDEVLDAEGENG